MKRNAFTAAVCLSTALSTALAFAPVALAEGDAANSADATQAEAAQDGAAADTGTSDATIGGDSADSGSADSDNTAPVAPTASAKIKKGATFTKSGITYKITKIASSTFSDPGNAPYNFTHTVKGNVEVVKYKGSKKAKVANSVSWSLAANKVDDETTLAESGSFTITSIGAGAFNNAKGHKVTSVSVGKNVASIGDKAFYGCKSLKKIALKGDALRTVGPNSDKSLNRKSKNYVTNLYKLRQKKWKICKAFKGTPRTCTISLPNINATKGLKYNMQYANAVRLLAGNAGFIGLVS